MYYFIDSDSLLEKKGKLIQKSTDHIIKCHQGYNTFSKLNKSLWYKKNITKIILVIFYNILKKIKFIYLTDHSFVIRKDFIEIFKDSILNQLKKKLENHQFYIWTDHEKISNDLNFIEKLVTHLKQLLVNLYDSFTLNDLKKVAKSLSCSKVKVIIF